MPARKVAYDRDGKIVVLPGYEDYERLKVSEYGRSYVALDPDGNSLYKLHRGWLDEDRTGLRRDFKKGYFWVALWNSVCSCTIDMRAPFDTVEEAISAALDADFAVRQLNMDMYKYLKEEMRKDWRDEDA